VARGLEEEGKANSEEEAGREGRSGTLGIVGKKKTRGSCWTKGKEIVAWISSMTFLHLIFTRRLLGAAHYYCAAHQLRQANCGSAQNSVHGPPPDFRGGNTMIISSLI